MWRLIGFIGGLIIFLVLGVKEIVGYQYYLSIVAVGFTCILLLIIFRVTAKYKNGFWKIWSKRLQKQMMDAFACLSHYIKMPEYQITHETTKQLIDKQIENSKSPVYRAVAISCLEIILFALLTIVCPLIFFFIIFCYAEAIKTQCEIRTIQIVKKGKKQEIIARQSTRMNLEYPQNKNRLKSKTKAQFITKYQRPLQSKSKRPNTLISNRQNHNQQEQIYYNTNKYNHPSLMKVQADKNEANVPELVLIKENQESIVIPEDNTQNLQLIANDQL